MSSLPFLIVSPVVAGILALSAGCGSTRSEATTVTNTTTAPATVLATDASEPAAETGTGTEHAATTDSAHPSETASETGMAVAIASGRVSRTARSVLRARDDVRPVPPAAPGAAVSCDAVRGGARAG
jgi:ABC-type Fe3+-hydroxamate transport system substrate-binding protein